MALSFCDELRPWSVVITFLSQLVFFFVLFQRERLTNTLTGHFKQASERYRGGGEMKDSFDYLTHES